MLGQRFSLLPALRSSRRAGFVLGVVALVHVACEPPAPARGPELQLNDGAVRLEPGARIHDVLVAVAEPAEFSPDTATAAPGDAVRFVADDARTHAIVFDAARLSQPIREFLEATDQLRGPPLITEGAVWIVSLDGAPSGRYPFTCLSHGGAGVLTVAER